MKFICSSDTQGQPPPARVSLDGVAAWLHAGDLYDKLSTPSPPRFSPLKTKRIEPRPPSPELRKWAELPVPLYLVRGNHDIHDPSGIFAAKDAFAIKRDMTGSVAEIAPGILVAGIGWHGERYYDLPREMDLEDACESVLRQFRMASPGAKVIVLTHYPAWIEELYAHAVEGLHEGWMYDCVRNVIDELRPVAVVAGHVHQLFGASLRYGNTLIIHTGEGPSILTLEGDLVETSVL